MPTPPDHPLMVMVSPLVRPDDLSVILGGVPSSWLIIKVDFQVGVTGHLLSFLKMPFKAIQMKFRSRREQLLLWLL